MIHVSPRDKASFPIEIIGGFLERKPITWIYLIYDSSNHDSRHQGHSETCSQKSSPTPKSEILLMAEILHQWIGSIYHYLQGFIHPRWCRISSINSSIKVLVCYPPSNSHILNFRHEVRGFLVSGVGPASCKTQ